MKLRRFNLFDIALFAKALPLAKRAQRVRSLPVPVVVADLCRRSGGSHDHPVERLSRAADRAVGRWAGWFGGMNTCLVRSLVLGALLGRYEDVVLNVGFRPGDDSQARLAGHAWITVGGRPVGGDGRHAETSYTRVLEIPYRESAEDH